MTSYLLGCVFWFDTSNQNGGFQWFKPLVSTLTIGVRLKEGNKLSNMASSSSRRNLARSTKPIPCYNVGALPPKKGGEELYQKLETAVRDGKAELIESFEIPARDARSWKVPAGCLWRIVCTKGPQVADMNCWNLKNPSTEYFYSSKTRQIHSTHLKKGDRLWSNMPYIRPLATSKSSQSSKKG